MAVKSEEFFNNNITNNPQSSVIGTNATGNASDYKITVSGQRPENKLHKYSNYTYRITLFFLTSRDFNNLCASPSTFQPKYSLISSAAGYATTMGDLVAQETRSGSANYDQTIRHPDFQIDFFIDNLSIQTIVGLNAKTKAANAVDISFTITEPYGLSLLDRLLSACETSEDASVNYMSQPYLLQVDLLRNSTDEDSSGTTNNVIDRKRIAVKLLEMKIKPTGSGTTYACKAIPFNHSAFDTTTSALPVTMSVEAGTVGEFFSSTDELMNILTNQAQENEERLEKELDKWIRDNTIIFANQKPTTEQIERQRQALKQGIIYNTKSLPAAYNGYMEKIATEKKLAKNPPTKIAFNIPNDEIAKSPIINPAESSSDQTRLLPGSIGYNKPDANFKKTQTFTLNAGTSIIDVIDMVMSKSEYVKKQIETNKSKQNDATASAEYTDGNERTGETSKLKKLKWYKILPSVVLNNFDSSTNNYSKTVLYTILPYDAVNTYHPNFSKIDSSNVADAVVRTYDYLYTGQNQDILRLDIDFDSSFYTLVTTKGDQVRRIANDSQSDVVDVNESQFGGTQTAISNPPVITAFSGSNRSSVGTANATNPEEQIISDMKTSLYTRQRGDALNLKLHIVGDPDFIKQDDIFVNPGSPEEYAKLLDTRLANNSTRPISDNGQILFDAEQVYVRVNIKNAIDIDDSIGIVNKQEILLNGRKTDGTFSGIYKVLTVQSEFSRGQFTQTLDLIRIPDALNQPKQPVSNTNDSNRSTTNDTVDKDAEAKRGIFSNPTAPAAAKQAPPIQTPTQPSQVAQVSQPLSFEQAFRQARKDFGNKPGGVFEWRGKLYQTNYQNEAFSTDPQPVYPGANQ